MQENITIPTIRKTYTKGTDRTPNISVSLGGSYKLNSGENPTYSEEYNKQYFYHSDHLGSASLISDSNGDEYQRIEYTPYGETWVEKTQNTGLEFLPYKFTAKEQDEETGLYYYGARYLDSRYSRWISTDPALGDYVPQAPISDEAKKHNQNLPGMGGVFNHINGNLYHYAGNNPVRYVDPDGREISAVLQNPSFWTGVSIIFGTVAEDIVTLGTGIIDDPMTLAIGIGFILGACKASTYVKNKAEISIDSATSKENQKMSKEKLMYHYTTVAPNKWVGSLKPGSYITPNGTYSGAEADNRLALPKDKYGNDRIPKYKYTFKVKEGEYTSAPNSLLH